MNEYLTKESYQKPVLEIIEFEDDIIVTSTPGNDNTLPFDPSFGG